VSALREGTKKKEPPERVREREPSPISIRRKDWHITPGPFASFRTPSGETNKRAKANAEGKKRQGPCQLAVKGAYEHRAPFSGTPDLRSAGEGGHKSQYERIWGLETLDLRGFEQLVLKRNAFTSPLGRGKREKAETRKKVSNEARINRQGHHGGSPLFVTKGP